MEDLQELIRQRKELDAKIREIKNQQKIVGCVKLDRFTGWGISGGYSLSVNMLAPVGYRKMKNIIVSQRREDLIPCIDRVINDLETMKEQLAD